MDNYKMRLSERKIEDSHLIKSILDHCHVVNIAFPSDEYPYIIPMLYGYKYDTSNNKLILYIHGASEGRKNDLINQGKTKIGFEINDPGVLLPTVTGLADDMSRLYKSIIGYGNIIPIMNFNEKKKAQELLMVHETGQEWKISEEAINYVTVYKINVVSFTGKQHRFSDYNGKTLNVPKQY